MIFNVSNDSNDSNDANDSNNTNLHELDARFERIIEAKQKQKAFL